MPMSAPVGDMRRLFDTLFFIHTGIVSWNGCSVDKTSACNEPIGGFFTHAFDRACSEAAESSSIGDWQQIMRETIRITQNLRSSQTPQDFWFANAAAAN